MSSVPRATAMKCKPCGKEEMSHLTKEDIDDTFCVDSNIDNTQHAMCSGDSGGIFV